MATRWASRIARPGAGEGEGAIRLDADNPDGARVVRGDPGDQAAARRDLAIEQHAEQLQEGEPC
jgi:hypothetical protein